MTATLGRVVRGVRWYLREFTGESRWDAYVEDCRRDHVTPMSRRHFERHQAADREAHPHARCC